MRDDFNYNYTLTYQDEERTVLKVEEYSKTKKNSWSSYNEFITQANISYNGENFEECFIIKELDNGDKIISIDHTKYQGSFGQDNSQVYFAYEQFGFKYPMVYFYVKKDGPVTEYQTLYMPTYSDWKITGTHNENLTQKISRIKLMNINLNNTNDNGTGGYFEVTQTLFNDDEKYEYLVPKLKMADLGNTYPSSDENNPYKLTLNRSILVTDKSDLVLSGIQVVSEDGTILKDLDFDADFEGMVSCNNSTPDACVITIGNNTYLAFPGQKNGNDCTVFYQIDRTTSSIQQAKSVPAALMQIVPTVAKSGSEINVNFGDDNKDGSQIEVISASGAKVKSMNVPAGQKSAQFSVNGASGLYCVSRVQKNQPRETKKIIIK